MGVIKILSSDYAIFRPDIQEYIKERILPHHSIMLDPMAGTAPLIPFVETHGHIAYFNDILPIYFFINRAKKYKIFQTCNKYGYKWFLRELLHCLALLKNKRLIISDKWIDDEVLGGLVQAWRETEEYDKDIATFLKAIVIMCVRPLSSITRTGNHTWIKFGGASSNKNLREIITDCLVTFDKYYSHFYKSSQISKRGRCIFSIHDASRLNLKRKVDIILTSPPYCNRLDNIRLYAPENYFLTAVGYGVPNRNCIGTNKVSDYDNFKSDFEYMTNESIYLKRLLNKIKKSPKQDDPKYYLKYYTRYFSMLNQSFKKLIKNLSPKGKVYIVLQDNTHRGELIEIDKALRELLNKDGWYSRVIKKWERSHLGLRNISRDYAFVKKKHFEKLMLMWQ